MFSVLKFFADIGLQAYAIIKWHGWWLGLALMPLILLIGLEVHNFPLKNFYGSIFELVFEQSIDIFLVYLLPLAVVRWLAKDHFKSGSMLIRIGCILAVLDLGFALASLYPKHFLAGMYVTSGSGQGPFYHDISLTKESHRFIDSNDPNIEKGRMAFYSNCGVPIHCGIQGNHFQINTYHLSVDICREGNDLIVNGRRLKPCDTYTTTSWPVWSFWYGEVEHLRLRHFGLIHKARIWENAWDWRGDPDPNKLFREVKTDIIYVDYYYDNDAWRLSWRGPALLAASLLLMLYGRRRLPKKPAISESSQSNHTHESGFLP